jgi:hypothetical protein
MQRQGRDGWDEEALVRAEDHVRRQLNGRLLDFRLEVGDAGVVLHGRAGTYHARQLAQHAIMAASELPIVRNAIEVS